MDKRAINAGMSAVGPYSQAVRVGDLVFTAGQIGLDPETRSLVEGGIQSETRQALQNLRTVLEAAGTSMDRAVKCTVYLVDIDREFEPMNEVYKTFFPTDPPARAAVQVAALYGSARIEIDLIAVV